MISRKKGKSEKKIKIKFKIKKLFLYTISNLFYLHELFFKLHKFLII